MSRKAGGGSLLCVGLASALVTTACGGPHVRLSAPDASAPPKERLKAYGKLRPLSMHETHVTTLQGGVPVGSYRQTDYLQLASGQRVYHAEDLLPVIPEQSVSAAAAREAESSLSTANTLQWVAVGLMVVGGMVMVASVTSAPTDDGPNMTPVYVGGGIMMAGLPVFFWGSAERSSAQDEKATAFETYDSSLRDQMGLCADGKEVSPCP